MHMNFYRRGKIIKKVSKEAATFQKVIVDFETDEKKYLGSRSVNKKISPCKCALKMV